MMKKFSKLLALCLALLFLIVCLAFGGCKKIGTQGESGETNGDTATTTAEQGSSTATTTAEQGVSTTTSSRVGDEVVLPGDDDVVIQIEGTASSSTVDTSNLPSGTSSSKASSSKSSSSGTSSSQSSSSTQNQTNTTKSTKYSRAPGETPIFGPNT